jgi:hypothetical protein
VVVLAHSDDSPCAAIPTIGAAKVSEGNVHEQFFSAWHDEHAGFGAGSRIAFNAGV